MLLRKLRIVCVGLLVCCGSFPVMAADSERGVADLVLHGGKILTVDRGFSIVQALAVRDGRIVATGSDAQVLQLVGPNTQQIDLQGQTVLPGLIDSHVHAIDASLLEFDHPVPDIQTIADVLQHVRERAAVVPAGDWIVLEQIFITRLREQRYPTRAELDAAAPHHPVAFRTGPDASVNSLALARSGIPDQLKPGTSEPGAGRVERDAAGRATGILRTARHLLKIEQQTVKPTTVERDTRLLQLLQDYNRVGITSAIDRAVSDEEIEQYRRVRDAGNLTVRMRLSYHLDTDRKLDAVKDDIRRVARHPLSQGDDRLKILGIKTFLDGGMLTGSAYMRAPWGVSQIYGIDDPEYRGLRYIEPDTLREIVRTTVENDFQFTAHSVGDGAVHALLDAYEQVSRETSKVAETHCCLTHSNFMSRQAIEWAARLGICVDIQPAWLYLDTRTLYAQFGNERLRYFQPLKSLFAANVIVGGGSDHMQKIGAMRAINPYHPFWGMWVACRRLPRWFEQGALHEEEALDRQQAIVMYTRNNAYLMRMENQIGSLEVGKLADFIVLDRDILSCPIDQLPEIQVVATYLSGVNVILRNSTGP